MTVLFLLMTTLHEDLQALLQVCSVYLAKRLSEQQMFQIKVVETNKTHICL
jgi:hypothetical protein